MSVISNWVAQPNRIIAATEFVHTFGDKGASMDDLDKMLSPLPPQQTLSDQTDLDSSERSGSTMARGVLNEMLRLKILERNEQDHLHVSAVLASLPAKTEWAVRLHDYLFPVLSTPDSAREHGQEGVPDALCWVLQQNPSQPLGFSGGHHYNILVNQLTDGDPLLTSIRNDARYQNAIYWAHYLGLAERVTIKPAPEMVISDPTRAISLRLQQIFGGERELTIQTFVQRLSVRIPMLDGGQVWRDIQGRLKESMQAEDRHLSQATSLALLRLQHAGKIKLWAVSDATSWVLGVGRESQPISHITNLENIK